MSGFKALERTMILLETKNTLFFDVCAMSLAPTLMSLYISLMMSSTVVYGWAPYTNISAGGDLSFLPFIGCTHHWYRFLVVSDSVIIIHHS
jgi:hypothetical protein